MVTVTDVGSAKALIQNEKGETRKVPLDRFAFDPKKGDKCEIVKGRGGSMLHKVEDDDDYMYDDDPYGDGDQYDDQYDDQYGDGGDPYGDAYDDDDYQQPQPRRRGGRGQQPRGRTRQEQADYDDYAGVNDDGVYGSSPRSGQGDPGMNAHFDDVTHLYTAASGGEKTVVCPRCSTVYDRSMNNCPVCGAKKGRKGIGAFIVFSWILMLVVIGALMAVTLPKLSMLAQKAQDSHNALSALTENSNGEYKKSGSDDEADSENSNESYGDEAASNENGSMADNENGVASSSSNSNEYADGYSDGNVTSDGTVYGDSSSSDSASSDSGSYYSDAPVNATVVKRREQRLAPGRVVCSHRQHGCLQSPAAITSRA